MAKKRLLMKFDNKMIVTKPETIVKARYKLSPLAIKFISTIIANLKRSDEIDKEYVLSVKEFAELTEQKTKRIYELIEEALDDLLKNPLTIQLDEESYLKTNWISSAIYNAGEISFFIDKRLRSILLEIKEKFLKYKLENILRLRSSYTIRLYEILKDWYELNKRYSKKAEKIISLQELRDMLEIPRSYPYGGSSGIKNRVIVKSQKELSQHTDIRFDYEEIKTGRKVTYLKFIISSTENQDKENKDIAIGEKKEKLTIRDIREELKDKILTIGDDYYYIKQDLLFKNGELLNKEEALLEYAYISNNWDNAKIVTEEEFKKLNKQKIAKELLETYKNKVLKLFPVGDDYKNLKILDIYDFESLDDFKVIAKDEEGKYYKFKSSLNNLKVYMS